MALEGVDTEVGNRRGGEQRHQELVAAGDVSDEEGGHEGCVHHARHHGRHADQGEAGGIQRHGAQLVAEHGHEVARQAAQDERGAEGAAHAAGADGGGGGHGLEQDEGEEDAEGSPGVARQRAVYRVVKQAGGIAVEQLGEHPVALAVEGREEVDEHAQQQAAHEDARPGIAMLGEPALDPVGGAQEIERHEGAEDAKHHVERQLREGEVVHHLELELHLAPHEEIGRRGRDQRRDEQRQGGGGGEVEEKHLDHEEDAGEGCLEDARDGTGGAAAEQEPHRLGTQAEPASDIAPDGRAGGGYRCLETHAAAEGHRDGRRHQRGPHILGRQLRPLATDGQQHRGEPVAYVATHYIPDKQHRKQYTHQRKHQHHHVAPHGRQLAHARHEAAGVVHHIFEQHRSQSAHQTHHHGQQQQHALLAHVAQAPTVYVPVELQLFFGKNRVQRYEKYSNCVINVEF